MKEKNNKINFFKRMYFSVCKIKKYGELSESKVKNSIAYISKLILILSIAFSTVLVLQARNNANELKLYLEDNFPELTYSENILTSEKNERVVLDHQLIKINFGGQIIIDTNSEYELLINEYKVKGEPIVLLTANKYVTINSQGDVIEYNYEDVIKEGSGQVILNKTDFINMFSNIFYSYYFVAYFLGVYIGIFIIVLIYSLSISTITLVVCKIIKIKIKYKQIYNMLLHALTVFIIGYFIMIFLPTSAAVYVQLLSLLIPIGYLVYAIYLNK